MTTIPARPPYSAPQFGAEYNRTEVREALSRLALSVPPTSGRTIYATAYIETSDDVLLCDATTAPFTATLRPASQQQFLKVWIVKIDSSGNAVTIGGTVSGTLNPTLAAQYKTMLVYSTGSVWLKLASQ